MMESIFLVTHMLDYIYICIYFYRFFYTFLHI
jgi:hypothetical protein